MRHPKINLWDRTLKELFDEIDDYIEEKYGDRYSLHPNRARRGRTSSKSQDGLFNVGADFSSGYGSEMGRGYVIDVDMVTLEEVPDDVREQIEEDVVELVRKKLPEYFPGRHLQVSRDGRLYKIHGDFSLGNM
jgi:hypothetical protein